VNEWFTIERTAVETNIGLGKRAKRLLEGQQATT
jgi:hypothetical protein